MENIENVVRRGIKLQGYFWQEGKHQGKIDERVAYS